MIMKKMICSVVLTALMTALLMVVLLPVCGVHAEGKPLTMTYVGPATLSAGQSGDVLKTVINSTESGTVTYTLTDVARNTVIYQQEKNGVKAGDEITWQAPYDDAKLSAARTVKRVKASFRMDGKTYTYNLFYNYSAKDGTITIERAKWYYKNTACSFGPAFRDIRPGMTDKWYTFTPVDLTVQGRQTFEYVASNMYVIGEVYVDVAGDTVYVSYYNYYAEKEGRTKTLSEFFTFFHDLNSVTEVEPERMSDLGFHFGQPISIQNDLNGDTRVLLFVRNMVDYSNYPIDSVRFERYWPNLPERVTLRNAMERLMD